MLIFITLSFLVLVHRGLGSNDISELMKKQPTWSFEVVSVETLIKNAKNPFQGIDRKLAEDMLRVKIEANIGPSATHIVTKTGDPKWLKNPPATFDARKHWKPCAKLIGTVEDEGPCKTEAPPIVASVAADRYCIFTNGTFKNRLSQQILSACADLCTGPNGGVYNSWKYAEDHGIPTGGPKSNMGCLPSKRVSCKHTDCSYKSKLKRLTRKSGPEDLKPCCEVTPHDDVCPKECSNPKYKTPLDKDRKKLTMWYLLLGYEFYIQNDILNYGPVATSIILFKDFLEHPKGIYEYRGNDTALTYHKYIKVIGWGEEGGTKYWLAVNTWNHWGNSKVFKILRGVNHLTVESFLSTGVYEDLE